ncbi:MAG: hypothetical protein LBJ48_06090 [Coriobacteriales bacterium]|jgi:hypothetical protein|nr:hypothetical protein [Coriobacteriales bacterium]
MATFTPSTSSNPRARPQAQSASGQYAQQAQLGDKPSVFKSFRRLLGRLSVRERVLIWSFAIVGVALALLFLLVLPAQSGLLGAVDEQKTLLGEQSTAQQTIATIPVNEELFASAETRHVEALLRYQAPQLPEDIDRMLTTLVEDCGFTAQAISLSAATQETVGTYEAAGPTWTLPTDEVSAGAGDATQSASSPNLVTGTEGTGGPSSAGTTPTDATDAPDTDATGADDGSTPDDGGGRGEGSSAAVLGAGEGDTVNAGSAGTTGAGTSAPPVEPQTLVYSVQLNMVGNDANYFALIDRVLPLSWLKIVSLSYTPPILGTEAEEEAEEAERKPYAMSLKLYANVAAEVKQP